MLHWPVIQELTLLILHAKTTEMTKPYYFNINRSIMNINCFCVFQCEVILCTFSDYISNMLMCNFALSSVSSWTFSHNAVPICIFLESTQWMGRALLNGQICTVHAETNLVGSTVSNPSYETNKMAAAAAVFIEWSTRLSFYLLCLAISET